MININTDPALIHLPLDAEGNHVLSEAVAMDSGDTVTVLVTPTGAVTTIINSSSNPNVIPGEPFTDLSVNLINHGYVTDPGTFHAQLNYPSSGEIIDRLVEENIIEKVPGSEVTYGYHNSVPSALYRLIAPTE